MKSSIVTFLFLILLYGLGGREDKTGKGPEETQFKNLLPSAQKGWIKEEPRFFTGETLFDYVDGGAELYLSYDFGKLLVQEYSSGDNSIIAEIYEMRSSEDAFGLFTLNQEGESLAVGQGASYGFGLLSFWKGHYFTRIIDMDGKDARKDIILDLGKEIAGRIQNEGRGPELLTGITRENLISQSLHYFHKDIVLNNLYFLSSENILNLSEETDAVLTSYRFDQEVLKLLLVQYPDTLESRRAYESFNRNHLKTTISSLRNLQRIGENLFTGVELKDRYLIMVLEAKTKDSVDKLLTATKESLTRNKVNE